MNVQQRNGLSFTDFNRTISDALANESMLDMQEITEAISRYHYANGESFEGIFVALEYQERFDHFADEAINYYYQSVYGMVESGWEKNGDHYTFTVSILCNTTARICLPDGSDQQVGASQYAIECSDSEK